MQSRQKPLYKMALKKVWLETSSSIQASKRTRTCLSLYRQINGSHAANKSWEKKKRSNHIHSFTGVGEKKSVWQIPTQSMKWNSLRSILPFGAERTIWDTCRIPASYMFGVTLSERKGNCISLQLLFHGIIRCHRECLSIQQPLGTIEISTWLSHRAKDHSHRGKL